MKCKNCDDPIYSHLDLCFPCAVREILITEHMVEPDDADRLCGNTDVMIKGIMSGNIRATAMALEMPEPAGNAGEGDGEDLEES